MTANAAKGRSAGHRVDENALQPKGWRLPAHEIEQLMLMRVGAFLRDRVTLLNALRFKQKTPDHVSALLARASKLAGECERGSFASNLEIVASLVRRVTVAQNQVTIEIDRKALADRLLDQQSVSTSKAKKRGSIAIEVPVTFRRRGVEAKLIVLGRQQPTSEPDANLVKALTRAHEWFGRIVRGEASGSGDVAKSEGLCRTYVTRVLCLAFLSPEIVRGILEGRQRPELTAKRLVGASLKLPLLWTEQRK